MIECHGKIRRWWWRHGQLFYLVIMSNPSAVAAAGDLSQCHNFITNYYLYRDDINTDIEWKLTHWALIMCWDFHLESRPIFIFFHPSINTFSTSDNTRCMCSLSSCKKRKCNSISRLPPRSSFTFFFLLTISKENLQVFQTCITAQHSTCHIWNSSKKNLARKLRSIKRNPTRASFNVAA